MFYLVRHGQTDWNREGRLQGSSEISLNNIGINEATWLKNYFIGKSIDLIVSSPSIRAYETSKIISDNNIPIIKDSQLRERNLGKYEGGTIADAITDIEKHCLQNNHAFNRNYIWTHALTVEDGALFLARITKCIHTYISAHPKQTIIFSTHGLVLKELMSHFLGIPLAEFSIHLFNCTAAGFHISEDNKFRMSSLISPQS